jgi:hypothetical protein
MKYMIERIDHEDLEFLYGWLWDRARAIRKDLTTQAVDKPNDIATYLECLGQCARLLLICLHHMAQSTNEDYSHQQDIEQLNGTLVSLKDRYNDNRRAGIISHNEAEFQAYRIIFSLHSGSNMIETEIQGLPENIRLNHRVQVAMQIFRAGRSILDKKHRARKLVEARQNWRAFWNLVESPVVSYLMACAAEIFFQPIRNVILDTIRRVYRGGPKHAVPPEYWTVPDLVEVLGLDYEDEAVHLCESFGYSFKIGDNGEAGLDISSITYDPSWETSMDFEPQKFSWKYVEAKRFDRQLSAVIKGMSVVEARNKGFVVEPELTSGVEEDTTAAEDSLFIPDTSTKKPAADATTGGLNPFANPFKPFGTPATQSSRPSTNKPSIAPSAYPLSANSKVGSTSTGPFAEKFANSPFTQMGNTTFGKPSSVDGTPTPQALATPGTSSTPFTAGPVAGQTVRPGLFDASKDAIRFSPSSKSGSELFGEPNAGSPFDTSSTIPTSSQSAEQASAQARSSFFPGALNGQSSGALPSSTLFQNLASSKPTTTTSGTDAGSMFNSPATKPSTSSIGQPFAFATAPDLVDKPLPAAFPAIVSTTQDEQRKNQEEEQRKAQLKAQQEQEIQSRREQEERERQAHEEKERLIRRERERQVREQQQRAAEQQRRQQELEQQKESAWNKLTDSIFLESEKGLLVQFVENFCMKLLPEVKRNVERERAEKIAEERYQWRKEERTRMYVRHWYEQVQKKKRARKARNRRKYLKEQANKLLASQEENTAPLIQEQANGQVNGQVNGHVNGQINGHANEKISGQVNNGHVNSFKLPKIPASAQRSTRRSRMAQAASTTPASRAASSVGSSSNNGATSSHRSSSALNNSVSSRPPVRLSTAPIDRTESEWFKLRAMGIDPRKHRKRSHDDSDEEQGEDEEKDRKRARTSPLSVQRASLPPTPAPTQAKDDDIHARFRELKASFHPQASASTPQASERPRSLRQSWDANDILANARAQLSASSTPQHSPLTVQHDFSRSVPDLGLGRSTYRRIGDMPVDPNKPAYWSRTSRFVPRHLYGKGAEAVCAELGHSVRSTGTPASVASPVPLDFSSPIPTQQSYVPETQASHVAQTQASYVAETQQVSHHLAIDDEEELIDYGEDSDEEMSDADVQHGYHEVENGEGDMEDEGSEEDDEDEEEEELFDEEEEYDDLDFEQHTQRPSLLMAGATQDAAIELSD